MAFASKNIGKKCQTCYWDPPPFDSERQTQQIFFPWCCFFKTSLQNKKLLLTFDFLNPPAARCNAAFLFISLWTLGSGDGWALRDLSHNVLYKHCRDSSVRSCRVTLWDGTVFVKQWADGESVAAVLAERPVPACPLACRKCPSLTGHLVWCVFLETHLS